MNKAPEYTALECGTGYSERIAVLKNCIGWYN